MSRSPRKRPTTASSSPLSRRRFVGGALALPALAALPRWRGGEQSNPYALVLGTAQDAGVPQVNCFNPNCNAVRAGARPAPRVASVGLVDAGGGAGATRRFLIDATPDFAAQVGDLLAEPGGTAAYEGSIPLADQLHGILLTHAHMGHYTGLVHLGREGAAARGLPLYASRPMAQYLSGNEPWASLVRNGHVAIQALRPGVRVALSARLEVTPFEVLHRQELSDTLGFLVHGPTRTLMYVPDADRWEGWPRNGIEAEAGDGTEPFDLWLALSDVALLDAAFYSHDELGHRPQGEVPHPPVVESMERLAGRLGDLEVWFTHLNNTNPLWNPDSPENATVRARGFGVAQAGHRITL